MLYSAYGCAAAGSPLYGANIASRRLRNARTCPNVPLYEPTSDTANWLAPSSLRFSPTSGNDSVSPRRSITCTVPRMPLSRLPCAKPALPITPLIELRLTRPHACGVSLAPRVTMLTMLKNAFVPYTDDTGPRISSMRAMSSIATNESQPRPANEPHDSFMLAPSTSTRMRVLKSPGMSRPRMPMP